MIQLPQDGLKLIAAQHDELFERAALRWHARLELEVPGMTLEESALALNALLALRRAPDDGIAEEALDALLRRQGLRPARNRCRVSDRARLRLGNPRGSSGP